MANEALPTAAIDDATATKTLLGRQDDGSRGAGSARLMDQSEELGAVACRRLGQALR